MVGPYPFPDLICAKIGKVSVGGDATGTPKNVLFHAERSRSICGCVDACSVLYRILDREVFLISYVVQIFPLNRV